MQRVNKAIVNLSNELELLKKDHKVPQSIWKALEVLKSWSEKESNQEAYALDHNYNLRAFSDGACRGNPGPGAWGIFGRNQSGETVFESTGVELLTTNNQMELQGAISCLLEAQNYFENLDLDPRTQKLEIVTDSRYVVDGVTKWVSGWKKRGWKKSDGKAPENLNLWKEIDELTKVFAKVDFTWVRGHAGHEENEICDKMANDALDKAGF